MKKSKLKGFWRNSVLLIFSCFLALTSFAQQKTLSGKVIGEDGAPIPGVTVVVKGTTSGTITDMDGKFTFNAPATAKILSISYIGMKTQEFEIGTQTVFNVTLVSETIGVDEVVVVGYGTRMKEELTGSISTVSKEQMKISAAPSVVSRMQGQISGVTVTSANRPGGEATIRIRGIGTINNADPLYVIDGVPAGPGNNINPNDVESITVLKDASSAAIYGTRGANGVVIITTKHGKNNQEPSINFSVVTGLTNATKQYDMLNTNEYANAVWLMKKNRGESLSSAQYGNGSTPVIPDYILPAGAKEGAAGTTLADYSYPDNLIFKANKVGTNWYDEIYRTGIIQDYDLSVSGGGEKGTYAFSGNYRDEDGFLDHTNFKRYTFRMNTETKFGKRLKVGESLQTVYINEHGNFDDNGEGTAISYAYRMQPIIPVYDIAGNFAGSKAKEMGNASNPVAILYRARNNTGKWARVLGNAFAEVTLMDGLSVKTLLGFNYGQWNYKGYTIPSYEQSEPNKVNGLTVNSNYNMQWNWTNTLNYSKTFKDIHRINVVLGTEAVDYYYESLNASRSQYFSEDPNYMQLDSGEINKDNSGNADSWSLFSVFGRANYDLMGKYFVEATVRRDGSSRFGSSNRYGTFPAGSVGWEISKENFMAETKNWLDLLKVRAGYGLSGNDQIGDYNSYTVFASDTYKAAYAIDGSNTSATVGFKPSQFGNESVSWEKTKTFNVGLNATLLKRSLNFSLDLWQRNTSDMLYQKNMPDVIGIATLPYLNIGKMTNKGYDIELSYNNTAMDGKFRYNITGTLSHYKNEVKELTGDNSLIVDGTSLRQMVYTRFAVGHAFPEFYGYIVDGIFQSDAEANSYMSQFGSTSYNVAGHYKFHDVSGDKQITEADRTWIGSPHPKFTGGLNIDLGYGDFDLNMFFYGSYGNKIVNYVDRWIDYGMFDGGLSKNALYNTWSTSNTSATIARLDQNDISQYPSTAFLQDGSFLKLKSLRLGYTLPKNLLQKIQIKNLRVYAQISNVFTITKYKGLDPEVRTVSDTGTSAGAGLGLDQGAWPSARQIMFGINLGL